MVEAARDLAQLRWFLIDPEIRGMGIGRYLLMDALSFCRDEGFARAFLMTIDVHTEAAALYRSVGFELTEEHPAELWGATEDGAAVRDEIIGRGQVTMSR